MNISLFVKAALIFSFFTSVLLGNSFNKKNDFQVWESQYLSYKLNPKTSLYFQTEFRWGDDASILYLSYLQGGVTFSLHEWLTIGPAYRHFSVLRSVDHKRFTVYAPLLDITLKFYICKWTLQDRSRIEYMVPEIDLPNAWVYRNRIKLISPWKLGKYQFNPFMFEEVFLREQEGYNQNRLAFGGQFTLAKAVKTEVCYVLRHIKLPNWRPNHVLGLYLYFNY